MSKLWRERSAACWCSEASRQSVGRSLRRFVVFGAVEQQPQAGGSMYWMRHNFPAFHTCFQDCTSGVDYFNFADIARPLGRVIGQVRS